MNCDPLADLTQDIDSEDGYLADPWLDRLRAFNFTAQDAARFLVWLPSIEAQAPGQVRPLPRPPRRGLREIKITKKNQDIKPASIRLKEKTMSTIYLLEAEHWDVPGRLVQACGTEETARSKANEIVSLMLDQSGMDPTGDWKADLARVQDRHSSQSCYVAITPLAINP